MDCLKENQRFISHKYHPTANSVLVLIINDAFRGNKTFAERTCNAPDLQRLHHTFGTQRKCIVREISDKHSTEILKVMSEERALIELFYPNNDVEVDAAAALVVFVLSHGDEKGKISTCHIGDSYSTADIWNGLDNQSFLKGVLKLLFIGPCRGTYDELKNHQEGGYVSSNSTWVSTQPNVDDYIILYSTIETTAANTNSGGSWFVTSICDVLDTLEEDCDSPIFFTRVKHLICGTSSVSDSLSCQTPQEHCLPHRPFKIIKSEIKHETDGKANVENVVKEERSFHYTWKADAGLPLRRGLAFIFSNIKTRAKADEFGARFQELDFYVRKRELQNVEEDLQKVSGSCGLRDDGCLVVCILAELEEGIKGLCLKAGDTKVPLGKLIQKFIGSSCPDLASKPKLVFLLDDGERKDAAGRNTILPIRPEDWNIAGNNHSGILAFVCCSKATIDNLLCLLQSTSLTDSTGSLQKVLTDVICKERSIEKNPKIKAQLASTLQYVLDFAPCRNRYSKPKFECHTEKNILHFEEVLGRIESTMMEKNSGHLSAWLLVAPPGIGKSEATKQISKELSLKMAHDYFVVPIFLRDHEKFFYMLSQVNEKPDCFDLLDQVVGHSNELEAAVKDHKVLVFLDGFDESCPTYKELVLAFIADFEKRRIPMWFTTRPHEEESVRKIIKGRVQSLGMLQMGLEDQAALLKTFLYRDEADCKDILKMFCAKGDGAADINGTPLQLKMLAELVLSGKTVKNETLTDLYFNFVQMKIESAIFKINGTTRKNVGFNKIFCENLVLVIKAAVCHLLAETVVHEELEDYKVEDDQDIECLNQLGLLTTEQHNGEIRIKSFAHRTYAEFLVSFLFLKKLGHFMDIQVRKLKQINVTKAFLENELSQVRLFIESFYASDNTEEKFKISKLENCFLREALIKENVMLMTYVCKEGLKMLFGFFFEFSGLGDLPKLLNTPFTYQGESNVYTYYPIQSACMFSEDWAMSLIKKGADIRLLDKCVIDYNKDLLFFAAEKGYVRILETAQKEMPHDTARAKIMKWNDFDCPLKVAASRGNLECVKNLLTWLESGQERDKYTKLAMMVAAKSGHVETIRHFVEQGDIVPKQDVSILNEACTNGQSHVIPDLVRLGFNLNKIGDDKLTPLESAARGGNIEVMDYLLKHGADIKLKDEVGREALHKCICHNTTEETVSYLINNGADVNCKDKYGNTPLHYAAAYDHESITRLLIAHQASIELRNDYDWLPMHRAVVHSSDSLENEQKCLKIYLEHNPPAEDIAFAWAIALQYGVNDVVKMFLDRKYVTSPKELVGKLQQPPLIIVASNANHFGSLLLEEDAESLRKRYLAWEENMKQYGIKAEERWNKQKSHPFSFSATSIGVAPTRQKSKYVRCIEILLEHGADVNQIDPNTSRSALSFAAERGHSPIVQLLMMNGAEINPSVSKRPPLFYAAGEGHLQCVWYLIQQGANVNSQDIGGHTALHMAAKGGHHSIVASLLEAGCDYQTRTVLDKHKAIHFCAYSSNLECFKILLSAEDEAARVGEAHATYTLASTHGTVAFMEALINQFGVRSHLGTPV